MDQAELTIRSLAAKIRLALWGIIECEPTRLDHFVEAALLALDDVQAEGRRRGYAVPLLLGCDELTGGLDSCPLRARSAFETGMESPEGAAADSGAVEAGR